MPDHVSDTMCNEALFLSSAVSFFFYSLCSNLCFWRYLQISLMFFSIVAHNW